MRIAGYWAHVGACKEVVLDGCAMGRLLRGCCRVCGFQSIDGVLANHSGSDGKEVDGTGEHNEDGNGDGHYIDGRVEWAPGLCNRT